MSIFGQGAFQTSANMTPQQIERKRALMAALMPRFGSAKYVGEGLGQLATGVAMGRQGRQLDRRENSNRQEGDGLFQRILSGASSRQPQGGGGFSILGQTPTSPGQSVANDTMAALGKPPMQSSISQSLARTESGGDYNIVNSEGYTGKYQWGQARLDDFNRANGTQYTTADLRGNPQLTEATQSWHESDILNELGGYVGQNVNGIEMTPGAIVAMAHLGGKNGAKRFIESGGQYDPADSNGTTLSKYARIHGGASPGQTQQVSQGGDIPLENLYSAMASPLLTDEQRSVITSMIQQRQQEADPMRNMQMQQAQLGLQKGQLELDQMRNPQPGYRVLTSQEAASMGLPDGAFQVGPDNKVSQIGGAGTNVNVSVGGEGAPGLGKLSADFGYVLDPETRQPVIDPATGLPTAAPVPGSPAALDAQKTAAAGDQKAGNAAIASRVVTNAAKLARDAAKKRDFGSFGQGVAGMLPWTDSAEVARQVDVLKSNAKIENLSAMRAASPTGGALGAVSDKESEMLAAKSGALDPSSPTFDRDLADYTLTMLQIIHGPEAGAALFDQEWNGGGAEGAAQTVPTFEDDAAYLRSLGLEP